MTTASLISRVCQVGDSAGRVTVAHLYHMGSHGVPRDREAALHLFSLAAKRGEPSAHSAIGYINLRRRHYARAVAAFRRAAKLNDPSGWAGIGMAYLYGAGLPQSDELGAKVRLDLLDISSTSPNRISVVHS